MVRGRESPETGGWQAALAGWGLPAPDTEPLTLQGTIIPFVWRNYLTIAAIGSVGPTIRTAAEALGFSVAILPEVPGATPPSQLLELLGSAG